MRDGNDLRIPALLDPAFYPIRSPRFPVAGPGPDEAGDIFGIAALDAGARLYPGGAQFGLKLADATRWINRDGGRSISDGPTNGNWCGGNWSGGRYSPPGTPMGSAPPLDSGDEACMRHDYCYDRAGNDFTKRDACDRVLIDELSNLPRRPAAWAHPPRPGTEAQTDFYRNQAIGYFRSRLFDDSLVQP